ncbi:MAG: ligase-associated DNA damage response DEXH box helicase [Casimicrobium sp.]
MPPRTKRSPDIAPNIAAFFASRAWTPFQFQIDTWNAQASGKSGLIHAPTGFGKTYAAFCGLLALSPWERVPEGRVRENGADSEPSSATKVVSLTRAARDLSQGERKTTAPPLTILWITPLKALAGDTLLTLKEATEALQPTWTVGIRTGDTPTSERAKQDRRLPTVLVTTPESLALLLTKADWRERVSALRAVIVDEWHELLSSKRGVLLELCLARLRTQRPQTMTWGMSATLGNLDEAMRVLIGPDAAMNSGGTGLEHASALISADIKKDIVIDSLMPETIERFPWAGHLGTRMIARVVAKINEAKSTLIFTNTRSQTELWYQALLDAAPELAGQIALHHGSLDKETRDFVEQGIRSGLLRAVVCTSSLDLGVDFRPVEQVLQIGSPKGIARLLQRAGRSGHQPGAKSRVTVVPTHAIELVEAAAARTAAMTGRIETRRPLGTLGMTGSTRGAWRALDVLAQHLVSCALGGGFDADELRAEVERTASFMNLTDDEWQWTLDFVTKGGASLSAYPDFHKVVFDDETKRYVVTDRRIAQRHRLNIGTIVSEASISVQFQGGARLGHVEEDFIARLNPGDAFIFAGRIVEFIRVREMTAYVKRATKKRNLVPRWAGGKMPLSTQLADATRALIGEAKRGVHSTPEMKLCAPIFALQNQLSALPDEKQWLIETYKDREGWHLFFFPFEGRLVHLGLATLFSYRLAKDEAKTFSISMNDYGFELVSPTEQTLTKEKLHELLDTRNVEADILHGLNAAELAKRQFREIARVAGLIDQGYPGANKTNKQLQMSSGLLFDVFTNYDRDNLLLKQAVREVMERQLEATRLQAALLRLRASEVLLKHCERYTPFSFPLMVERLREKLTTEQIEDRVARMVAEIEEMALASASLPQRKRR